MAQLVIILTALCPRVGKSDKTTWVEHFMSTTQRIQLNGRDLHGKRTFKIGPIS